jgi:hypothetical protein
MRISDLTQEERKAFEEHLLSTYRYDAATGKLINKKWNREYPGMINKSNGYVYVFVYFRGERFQIWKHRLVFFLVRHRFPKEIDHINGIKTDNRIENLREVSRSENEANKLRRWKKILTQDCPAYTKDAGSFVPDSDKGNFPRRYRECSSFTSLF